MSARDVIADVAFEGKVLGHPIRFEMGRSKADAILSALDKAGYAVVPKEPTEDMIEKFCDAMSEDSSDDYKHAVTSGLRAALK